MFPPRRSIRRGPALPRFEPLERRELLSSVLLGPDLRAFSFLESDGDLVRIALSGPGLAAIAVSAPAGSATSIESIHLEGTGLRSSLDISVVRPAGDGLVSLASLTGHDLGSLRLRGVTVPTDPQTSGGTIHLSGFLANFFADARTPASLALRAGDVGRVRLGPGVDRLLLQSEGGIDVFTSAALSDSSIASAGSIGRVTIAGNFTNSLLLAGATLGPGFALPGADFDVASLDAVSVRGHVADSVIAAGAHPGADGLFSNGEVLPGGRIGSLTVTGLVSGEHSPHTNPGIYAASLGTVSLAGHRLAPHEIKHSRIGLVGRAVLDPLPGAGTALTVSDIESIIANAAARAAQLRVNATISLVDREGNILAVVRTTDPAFPAAPETATISAGGSGGLEGVTVPSSVFATSKAGTAAFLSTSGNAFTTRTAGFIIQKNFPPGVRNQPSGPLFGVQFSSLPTSDINQLPIGLAADPGGLPLYRNGQVVAGIGVELDGLYTAPESRVSRGGPTLEERIALAGQIGFNPPREIAATRILVNGIRFAFTNAAPPKLRSLGTVTSFADLAAAGRVTSLIAPRISPATFFSAATFGAISGETVTGFQNGRVEALAVPDTGTSAFIIRVNEELERELYALNLTTGADSFIANLSDDPSGALAAGDSVSAMVINDQGTASTVDDTLLVFNRTLATLVTVDAATGEILDSRSLADPDATLRDAVFFDDAGADSLIGISDITGQVFKLRLADVSNASNIIALSPAATPVQSFAIGPGGLFAVRETGPASASRELVRLSAAGLSVTTIEDISDGDPNEIAPGLDVRALAYDDAGTDDPSDDSLIAQNSTIGRQFVMDLTGAIADAPISLADPRVVLTSARFVSIGADDFLVGVSAVTDVAGRGDQVYRLDLSDPASAASVARLTDPDTTTTTRAGVTVDGESLTPGDVAAILTEAHRVNDTLRAAIRKDRPQVSQVTVSVVDVEGNLLGVFRTSDAPVFGFDVAVQKARSAAFFSRSDAGARLRAAEAGQFASFADRAAALGINLDGSIALSDRAIGFLARPFLPDGIQTADLTGPFSTATREAFSPFNTGLQTELLITNLVTFLTDFAAIGDESLALAAFDAGLLGGKVGGGVTDPAIFLRNGAQIFPGSVPLYKNGVLVGGIGVSGDGIEQDDLVAFAGANIGFQAFPAGVQRSDFISIRGGDLRLPYIKIPRVPSGGF